MEVSPWSCNNFSLLIFPVAYFISYIILSEKSEALDSFKVIKNVPFRNNKIWGLYYTILNVLLHFNGKDSYKIYMSDFKYHSPSPSLISKLGFQEILNRRNENINIKFALLVITYWNITRKKLVYIYGLLLYNLAI